MSRSLPIRVLYYGEDDPLPEPVRLRAGPLSLIYQAGDLRYVKLGEREVIRRIYAAVRDRNWGTIAARFKNVTVDAREGSFQIRYDAEHKERNSHFVGAAKSPAARTARFVSASTVNRRQLS